MAASTIATAASAADAERGRVLFGYAGHDCLSCHPQENSPAPFGPSLCGILGRAAATDPRYGKYSDALKASGIVWTRETLAGFVAAPMTSLRGTRMGFGGIEDATELADLLAYLEREARGELCLWDQLTPP